MAGKMQELTPRDYDLEKVIMGRFKVDEFLKKYDMDYRALPFARRNLNKKRKIRNAPPLPPCDWTRKIRTNPAPIVTITESAPERPYCEIASEIWQAHKAACKELKANCLGEHRKKINIKTDAPIGIAFIGDVHLDSNGCDIHLAESDAELISNTPGLYAVLTGDIIDNSRLKYFGSMTNQLNPDSAEYLLYHYLDLFGSKVLAMHSGNHDEWIKTISSINTLRRIAKQKRISFSPFRAELEITVGEIPYLIYSTHETKYNSSMNLSHGAFRALERCNEVPIFTDVFVASHSHTLDIEARSWKDHKVIAIKSGTYKLIDELFQRYGMNSDPCGAGVVLWPKKKLMQGFSDFRAMAECLRSFYSSP